jgi:hypothetical protein
VRRLVIVCLFAVSMLACGHGQPTIPPDGQQVRIDVLGSEVLLDPATVRAGDVYVVLATPGSSVWFARSKPTAEATEGPMSDADIRRLAGGSSGGMSLSSFDESTCSDEGRAADAGRLRIPGGCGNVFKETLTPGKYAFFVVDPERGREIPVAVLEVLP